MFISDPALIVRLLLGHVVADFLLQSRSMIDEKRAKAWKSGALYIHSGIYAAIIFIAASAWTQWLWLVPVFFVSHAFIDGWKASRENRASTFVCDQVAHLAVLILVFFILSGWTPNPFDFFRQQIWTSPRLLFIILGYLLVLWPVGRLMNVITYPFRQQLGDDESRGLKFAGFWIGCLERTFLLTFVLFGYFSGIALLLGLKSLFRFGEIKNPANRKETEYILIGTLLSFGFALAAGFAVKAIIKTLP
ncbi:MAG: DUF3307 domain-containing protein [Candidatus Aminicenantes bacterium]|nr:DUF3307 domain-containing protein [Candidatus Aminicenantes bacterium]